MKSYKYEILGVIFAVMLLNIWYLGSIAVESRLLPYEYKNVIGFFTSAFGAMAGAYSAFQFNRLIEQDRKEKELIDDFRYAIFLTAMKLNQLRGIMRDSLQPNEDKIERWGAMMALNEIDEKEDFNNAKLSFLQQDYGQFIMDLALADDCYKLAIRQVNYRSYLHREKLQSYQAEVIKNNPEIETYQDLTNVIDKALLQLMVTETNNCFLIVPTAISRLEKTQEALFSVAKERFKGVTFLDHDALYKESPT